jgi:hypothetical protein
MEIALLLIQILTLIALIVYVAKTWEMASATKESAKSAENTLLEMREMRDQESAPYVIVFFDVPYAKSLVYLVIKNLGKSIAKDVKLSFEPSLQSSDVGNLENLSLFDKGIASLAPAQELRVLIDTTVAFFGEPGLPLISSVAITYHGGLKDELRTEKHTLDLSVHKGLMYIQSKDIHDLNESVEKLLKEQKSARQSLERISKNLESGIFLNNPTLTISNISSDDKEWRAMLFAKLQEFIMMWETAPEDETQKKLERLNMQTRILLISGQILTLLSIRPDATQQEIATQVHEIAAEMQAMGRKRMYADGGVSMNKYCETGDELMNRISRLITRTSILRAES